MDDSSKDQSYERVKKYIDSSLEKNIFLFQHEINLGKGTAVKTGISKSSGDVLIIQDADLELTPKDIPSLLSAKQELGVPFINGSRYIPGVLRTQAAIRTYFFNKLFPLLLLYLLTFTLPMWCGYKLFDKNLFEKLNLKEN